MRRAPRSYTIDEVVKLGFEACHRGEGGILWLVHGPAAMLCDPVEDRRVLVFDLGRLPRGPWHPTEWGEQELRRLEDGDPPP